MAAIIAFSNEEIFVTRGRSQDFHFYQHGQPSMGYAVPSLHTVRGWFMGLSENTSHSGPNNPTDFASELKGRFLKGTAINTTEGVYMEKSTGDRESKQDHPWVVAMVRPTSFIHSQDNDPSMGEAGSVVQGASPQQQHCDIVTAPFTLSTDSKAWTSLWTFKSPVWCYNVPSLRNFNYLGVKLMPYVNF